MSDIVKRLRKLAEDLIVLDLDMRLPPGSLNPHLAADEIERIRAENVALKGALRADAEQLRLAGDRVGLATGPDTPDLMADEITRLRRELAGARNAALKEAANAINVVEPDEDAAGGPASWGDFVQVAQSTIRRLKEKPE